MKTTGMWTDGDDIIERRSFDAEPYLDAAKALHNSGQHGSSELKHAASYPPGFFEYYAQLKGITYQELMGNPVHVKRMLNDPELGGFRIWKGRV